MDDDILPPGWKFRRNMLLTPEPLPPDLETWSSVLEFKAQRCFLTIGTVLSDEDEPNHVIASLVKDGPHSDAVIGAIVLNIAGPDAIPTGARCELIAISSGDAGWVASFLAIGNAFPNSSCSTRITLSGAASTILSAEAQRCTASTMCYGSSGASKVVAPGARAR